MRTNTAEQLAWPTVVAASSERPDPEPDDLATCLTGANGAELVAEIAHDLRSPLTSILLLAEALQNGQGGSVTEAQRRALGLLYIAVPAVPPAAVGGTATLLERGPRPRDLS